MCQHKARSQSGWSEYQRATLKKPVKKHDHRGPLPRSSAAEGIAVPLPVRVRVPAVWNMKRKRRIATSKLESPQPRATRQQTKQICQVPLGSALPPCCYLVRSTRTILAGSHRCHALCPKSISGPSQHGWQTTIAPPLPGSDASIISSK